MQSEMCTQVFPKLAGVADDTSALSPEEQGHVSTCLTCQAELVSYKKLLRAMHDLRENIVAPSPSLLAGILENIGERAERRAILSLVTGKRAAYTGGIAVAAAAGITGAILLAGRGRSRSKSRKAA